jgi:hypothetical protein
MFVLLPSVKLPKLLHVDKYADAWADRVPTMLVNRLGTL